MVRAFRLALVMVSLVACTRAAEAAPLLQLDIVGGYYDTATQTIVSGGPTFQLVAILTQEGTGGNGQTSLGDLLAETYYISAGIVPQTGPTNPVGGIGSFVFDGSTVQATADMNYGVPPLDEVFGNPDAELGGHGIFPTFFSEFSFQFDPAQRTDTYNTEDQTGTSPVVNPLGQSYFRMFTVSTAALNEPYELHFDLYNEVVKREAECRTRRGVTECTPEDLDAGNFAPFSHDAESGDLAPVPEPATLLLTLGGLGAIVARKRRAAKAQVG